MSWTDKELSEMAGKAQADQVFTYEDSYWREMEALLPTKKRKFWPLGIGLSIIAIGTAILFTSPIENSVEYAKANNPDKFDIETRTVNSSIVENKNTGSVEMKNFLSGKSEKSLSKKVVAKIDREFVAYGSQEKVDLPNKLNNPHAKSDQSNIKISKPFAPIFQAGQFSDFLTDGTKNNDGSLIASDKLVKIEQIEQSVSNFKTGVDRLEFTNLAAFDFEQNFQPTSLISRNKRNFFSAYGELGFTLGESYFINKSDHLQAIVLGAGVRMTKNRHFIQTGVGFEIEKAGVELTETAREYGYSLNTFENKLNYKGLYRAFVPFNFGYVINKHMLQMGVAASYLIGTKMTYAYLENEILKRNETIYGEKKGWNSFGLKLNVGYGFGIFPSTTLGVNVHVQLINQLNTNWTKEENKLPISGQVFVRKTIR